MDDFPADALRETLGSGPVGWHKTEGGYTRARRWVVELADGSTAFVKAATGEDALPLRREIDVLSSLRGGFHPRLDGAYDDGDLVVLVIENLASARWPPPYPNDASAAFSALDRVAEHEVPDATPVLTVPSDANWPALGEEPEALLDLRLCSRSWLATAVAPLSDAEHAFDPTGPHLVHNDVWAGNIAFADDRCVLVDWAEARRGSRWVDVGFLTLSLRSEGGPVPTTRFPGDHAFAAWWSGNLAQRLIGDPEPWLDPAIRDGLSQDLGAALDWAGELFGLPDRTGGG